MATSGPWCYNPFKGTKKIGYHIQSNYSSLLSLLPPISYLSSPPPPHLFPLMLDMPDYVDTILVTSEFIIHIGIHKYRRGVGVNIVEYIDLLW